MDLCLLFYRAPLLLGGLLFLLLLAVSALQAGRPSPVVLGETRVQSWVCSQVLWAEQGSGAEDCLPCLHLL